MSIVTFNVFNNLQNNTGERVLVFLTPTDAEQSLDYNYAAWQILNPPTSGGSQPFTFEQTIQLAVQDENLSKSPTLAVQQGTAYSVTNPNNQGPTFARSGAASDPALVEVTNNTVSPVKTITSIWSIDNNPVVSQGGLNQAATQSFQLFPTLYFMVAIPTETGFNWKLQEFSNQFQYVVPTGVTQVTVTWSRPSGSSGADVITFDPPSAAPPSALVKRGHKAPSRLGPGSKGLDYVGGKDPYAYGETRARVEVEVESMIECGLDINIAVRKTM